MNQETVQDCPICGCNEFIPYLICKDYLVSQTEFSIQQCTQCQFRFTSPRPAEDSLSAYYKSDAYVSHNDQSGGLVNTLYRLVRQFTLRQKLKLINSVNPQKGTLLDVGCGTGLFLETCKQGGWSVEGVEPDSDARQQASMRLSSTVNNSLSQVAGRDFDLITMWHVLEHVPNLEDTVKQLKTRLKQGGHLLLALPNSNSLDAQHYGTYWAAYDIPRHLSHFTPATIQQLISQAGFTLHKTYPMYFDSFYVCMLSTQHRDGRVSWPESIYQGFRSNLHASKTGNYSSLIYLFRKV